MQQLVSFFRPQAGRAVKRDAAGIGRGRRARPWKAAPLVHRSSISVRPLAVEEPVEDPQGWVKRVD